jgi:HSP20 family protein
MAGKQKMAPRSAWSFPSLRFPFSMLDENEEEWLQDFTYPSGLSVSEDENHVYIEAALPGIKPDEIEMTYHKGMLWIKAEKKEEPKDKNRKFYRKATSTFSYHVAIPGNVDDSRQPEAVCKNGVITVTFTKTKREEPRKIPIKG